MTEYLKTIVNRIGETNEVLQVVANRIGETNELLLNGGMRAPRGSAVQAAQALRSQQAEQQADASDQSAPV